MWKQLKLTGGCGSPQAPPLAVQLYLEAHETTVAGNHTMEEVEGGSHGSQLCM